MAKRVTDQEREEIIAALASGSSCNEIAKRFGRATRTISGIAKDIGHEFAQGNTKKARAAKAIYDRANRLDLIDLGLQKQREMLEHCNTPHKMQAWWIGVGIGIDKRRLDEETRKDTSRLEAIFSRMDDIADDYERDTVEPETSVDNQP